MHILRQSQSPYVLLSHLFLGEVFNILELLKIALSNALKINPQGVSNTH